MDLYAKELVKEIETLRKEVAELRAVRHKAIMERDEWKHRLHEYRHMLQALPGSILSFDLQTRPGDPGASVSYSAAIEERYPETAEWFEEE